MKMMKTIIKISVVALLALLCIYLMKNAKKTSYYPLTVIVELKSNEREERCQIFYSSKGGFSEAQSIVKPYSGDTLQEITFILPAVPIRNIRIDPGFKSVRYEVKRIVFQVENQQKVYSGDEIPDHFTLTNLIAETSSGNKTVTLLASANPDVQLLCNQHTDVMFDLVKNTETLWGLIVVIITIYFFVAAIIFMFGTQLINGIVKVLQRLSVYLFRSRMIAPTKFSVSVIFLFFIKLFLVSFQNMNAITTNFHDDALFIKLAYSLASGHWLGDYNNLTLAKGIGYPMFIALTNFFGIRLFFAQHVLLGIAAYLMVKALSPLVNNTNWKILLFAVLLFNPVTSDKFTIRVLRDHFFVSISIIEVAGFIAVYLRRHQNAQKLLKWSVVAGIALFVQQNTREEGFVFLPFLIFLSVLILMTVVRFKFVKDKFQYIFCTLKRNRSILLIIVLPYFVLIVGNLTLASINYVVYGGFIRNEIKSEAFTDAFAALTKIDSEKWIMDVPVTTETRMKAYRVSPAFAELEKYMEGEGNGYLRDYKYLNEITGANFFWALRYAAQAAGYHQSFAKSQQFYKQVAFEINDALETGKLKKRDVFSMSSFSWDDRFTIPTLIACKEIVGYMVSFKGYSPLSAVLHVNPDDIARFQNITNERACIAEFSDTNQPLTSGIKFRALMLISKVYGFGNPAICLIALFSFILLTVLIVLRKATGTIRDYWLLSFISLMLAASRMVLMAYVTVSQWNAVSMLYLSVGYPFLILFEFLSIVGMLNFLFRIYARRRML